CPFSPPYVNEPQVTHLNYNLLFPQKQSKINMIFAFKKRKQTEKIGPLLQKEPEQICCSIVL
ncbi:MAG: hypothetical protein IKB01_14805, partial [Lachnospiraceae bacterium]|nr:hypothetical protein [Lachnospiraceae bacterium]